MGRIKYLDGELLKIDTDTLKACIGRDVRYLRDSDIDKTGRGYYFPRVNTIKYVTGRQIIFTDYNSVYFQELREIQLIDNDEEI